MIVPLNTAAIEEVAARLDLREPNRRAVAAVAEALDRSQPGVEIVCDLATATGKTYIAAGLIDYLAAAGVRHVLFVCPGSTILTKTIANFTPGSSKFVSGLDARPTVVTAEDFQRGSVGEALRSVDDLTLLVFNVQQLIQPTAKTSRKVRDYDEHLGSSLYEHLRSVDDLVVIADEHHTYFGPQFSRAIRDLSPQALIGLTATPHPKTDPTHVVFHYPLAEAIADGYVKVPVLVARRDGSSDVRRQLADGLILLKHKALALASYAEATGAPVINPVMFLVCSTIEEANEIAELLAGEDMLGSSEAVLTVTSESPDAALEALSNVEDAASPVRAIVSVQMLKEGWDVRNIYVVCALRALESEALSEQVLGRGLRLPFGERTGRQMLDTVEVLSHRKFRDLLSDAGSLLEAFFTERHPAQFIAPDQEMGLHEGTDAGLVAAADDIGRLDVLVAPTPGLNSSDELVEGGILGASVEDVERRIAEAEQQALALSTTMDVVTGAERVDFPRVVSRLVPQPFSLSTVPNQAASELGAQFATDTAPTLDRQALDALRISDSTGEGVRIEATVAEDPVEASQLSLPLDELRDRIRRNVLQSRFVTSTRQESNAINRLVGAFLEGADVTDTDSTTWTDARVANAVSAFLSLVRRYHSLRGTSLQAGVELVRYPPEGIVAPDEVFARTAAWAPRRWYRGWTRSLLPAARFDARTTELALAELFEASPEVRWWVRVEAHQDVWIPFGHRQRYFPDFIVITDSGDHWVVEGKADDRANDPEVLAKKAAGLEWARFANDSGEASATWHYLFATETAIKQAGGSWAGLVNFAEWE